MRWPDHQGPRTDILRGTASLIKDEPDEPMPTRPDQADRDRK